MVPGTSLLWNTSLIFLTTLRVWSSIPAFLNAILDFEMMSISSMYFFNLVLIILQCCRNEEGNHRIYFLSNVIVNQNYLVPTMWCRTKGIFPLNQAKWYTEINEYMRYCQPLHSIFNFAIITILYKYMELRNWCKIKRNDGLENHSVVITTHLCFSSGKFVKQFIHKLETQNSTRTWKSPPRLPESYFSRHPVHFKPK